MFNFRKEVNPALQGRIAERQAAKQAARDAKVQSKEQVREDMLDSFAETHNIAVYFNQQFRDNPGYTMSIREKDQSGAGSTSIHEPVKIVPDMIATIRNNEGVFLEGHVRTKSGLIQDVYDSGQPDRILRDRFGHQSYLMTKDLEKYEEARLKPKKNYGPRTRVVMRDDLSDVGLTGAVPEDDGMSM